MPKHCNQFGVLITVGAELQGVIMTAQLPGSKPRGV